MKDRIHPKIRCENVWKVFGHGAENIVSNWEQYKTMNKVERLEKTGCVVGTRSATFEVAPGKIFCLMGLSGSGKSTLLRCINRLHEPSFGKVFIDDQEITSLNPQEMRTVRREKTGMVFQHFALLPHRRLIDNAAFGLEVQGLDKKTREQKACEALELVGLKGWEKSYPYELSGGMQQRVGLARALATNPEILLMDEAFSALDPLIKRQMQDEFVKLIKKVKKTILFVTHDLHEALRIANHIAIMKDGAIVQQGTPAQIVLNPAKGYVEEFVKDLPKTKFITARDIMQKPDMWVMPVGSTSEELLNKMNKNNLRYAFLVDENQQIKCTVDYFSLRSSNGSSISIADIPKDQLSPYYPLITVSGNTFLESLLNKAADTKVPIVVTDSQGRIEGVISRETMLVSLQSA
ncbi:MAG: glycine betaine/L-proline ABC transporter ATP-binding protein [Proteobacteria bacterium]|nr:glycine betaine/L-proline ABC transporter ATP-binding protein [Pseudomonadota bacterium]MBU1585542.1 glycine betaine/L-proline ABC transporter ATP-binding protein [Pseudomonadota bacterium]MBU2454857.1 glycine betaine/L-proline ABC transporter ATP-binding protein [Pseudomonadota bacterium]MBU2630048.1 glycine betaine/L-proline ABC transporter ATP-binding protein [Pseudomonadota bacterium]